MHFKLSLCATLIGVALAAPSRRSPLILHEKRAAEPLDWEMSRRLEANKVIPLRFGLTQQNVHRLEELLMAVSHPESSTYGKHYTPAEVVDLFSPSDETISTVTKWLVDSGFSRDRLRLSANKGWISMNATISEAEDLLDAEYHVYTHPSGDEQFGSFFIDLLIMSDMKPDVR
jgi:tripeptidyl-peptidase-1